MTTLTEPTRLGIIAGGGTLPQRIVRAGRDQGRPLYVAALSGHCAAETVSGVDHGWFDLAGVGHITEALRRAGCRDVVFAGSVGRPDLARLKPDWQGIKLLPRVIAAAARGDDALLKVLVGYLEEIGFRVVSAEDCLGLDALATPGPLGRLVPDEAARRDIDRAVAIARALGALDVGQGAVVRDLVVLGVEAVEGTDAMLRRAGDLAPPGRGGVLVKLPKPSQERRVDLPTIGVATVENAAAARLAGIAVEAGGTLVLDRDAVAAAADRLGLFVIGFPRA